MEEFPKIEESTTESDDDGFDGESSGGNTSEDEDQSLVGDDDLKNDPLLLLKVSISTAKFMLKGGIPFHGTDDLEMSSSSDIFLETVKFFREQCPNVNEASLQNPEESNRVVDPSIQKDIVTCFTQEVLKSILEEIGDDVFALIVDEYSDMEREEHMSVVIRYVTCGIVKERFLGLIHVSDRSAVFLKSAIESLFAKYGLSLKKVRGQGYDGKCDMVDVFSDLKGLIMKENNSAYYVHCFAYELQAVLVRVAQEHFDVGTFFDKIAVLKDVVGASCDPKDVELDSKNEKLQEAIGYNEVVTEETDEDYARVTMVDACGGSHYTTVSRLVDLFSYVFDVLEYIHDHGRNNNCQFQAYKVIGYFDSFEFVFTLHLMLHILGLTDSLLQAVKRKEQDISSTMSLVKSTIEQLQKFRIDGFELLLKEISSFCQKHEFEMLNMEEDYVDRGDRRQKTNITNRHYYESDVFNTVVDMQIQELCDRFTDVSSELLTCMAALSPHDSFSDFDVSKLMRLAELYPDDFSCEEIIGLESQLDSYIHNMQQDERFANLNGISDLARIMVETRKDVMFPLVYRLLKLALVLPVATPTVERCFSARETVKSYLRNQKCDDFVNTCLISVVNIDSLYKVTKETIVDRLQKMETHIEQPVEAGDV